MDPNNQDAAMESRSNQDQNTMLTTFMEITSSTPDEASFFLESHNYDLDAAVSTFYESTTVPTATDNATPAEDPLSPQEQLPSSPSSSPSPSRSRSHSPPPRGSRSQYNLRSRPRGGVLTFSDLNRDDDDDDADRPPQYFTGGQRSGMLVQDPTRDNNVDALFEQARRMGAVEGPAEASQPSSTSRSFTGTARLLSEEMVSTSRHEPPPEAVTHNITFWRNGFTVDDGPLRRFDDQANASFLESIKKSECPKELEPKDRRTSVSVNLRRKAEDCPEPEKRNSFQGVGRTLGSSSAVPSELPSAAMNSAPSPVMGLVVDDQFPSTSIQLRLADGTRMVSRFNYHHTVRDIHGFIDASRPARTGAYTLQMMGFPPKQLTDLGQTIEEAGLANSVVVQKF